MLVPEAVDSKYIKDFTSFIASEVKRGNEFIIVTGGGKTARVYLEALKKIKPATFDELEWMGIYTTWLNAQLLVLSFNEKVPVSISYDPEERLSGKRPIIVSAGWKPGGSTDRVAAVFAKTYKCKSVINLTNVDYVYDKDPRKFKSAKRLESISWKAYRKLVGSEWSPGANYAFDPIAAKVAEKEKLQVYIASGRDLKNVKAIIDHKKFKGTVIA